jgi:hypothetical protein
MESMEQIHVSRDKDKWQVLVDTVMNFRVL